jgi:uncharacterized protein YgiM (DUF1202 family)
MYAAHNLTKRLRRLICLLLIAAAFTPQWSLARSPQSGPVPNLPRGHREVVVRGNKYFYHGGHFYRPAPRGYMPVRAPIGAVLPALPVGFAVGAAAGVTYYSYMGVYYRRIPAGYVVVEPPVVVAAPPVVAVAPASPVLVQPSTPSSGSVQVTVASLNVRTGPGPGYAVVAVAYAGDVLTVQGISPGWLYVALPNGTLGWVAGQFTTQVAPPASG